QPRAPDHNPLRKRWGLQLDFRRQFEWPPLTEQNAMRRRKDRERWGRSHFPDPARPSYVGPMKQLEEHFRLAGLLRRLPNKTKCLSHRGLGAAHEDSTSLMGKVKFAGREMHDPQVPREPAKPQ